jgi:hypothetical protein
MFCLRYLCLFAYSDILHILCCVFVLIVFIYVASSIVFPLLIAPSVFSNVYFLNVRRHILIKINLTTVKHGIV